MNTDNGFYTLNGYRASSDTPLTASMEDYLEMIYRMVKNKITVRTGGISKKLHVKPSSVTKMIQQLSKLGYIESKLYGEIHLTDKGYSEGEYLLYRHEVLHRFFCYVNKSDNELEQVELTEHYFNKHTIANIDTLTIKLMTFDKHN